MPWPEDLVVNIGSNARAATSLSMPTPVSETSSRTKRPGDTPGSAIVSRSESSTFSVSKVSVPPSGIASRALTARLIRTCSTRAGSSAIGQRSACSRRSTRMCSPIVERRNPSRPVISSLRTKTDCCPGLAPGEDHQLPDEADAALGGAADLLDVGVGRGVGRHPAGGEAGVVDDHPEDVVEVVCDAAGELADHLQRRLGIGRADRPGRLRRIAGIARRLPVGAHSSRPHRIAVATAAARSETSSFS